MQDQGDLIRLVALENIALLFSGATVSWDFTFLAYIILFLLKFYFILFC